MAEKHDGRAGEDAVILYRERVSGGLDLHVRLDSNDTSRLIEAISNTSSDNRSEPSDRTSTPD